MRNGPSSVLLTLPGSLLFRRRRILHVELGLRDIAERGLDLLQQQLPLADDLLELFRRVLVLDLEPLQRLDLQLDRAFLARQRFDEGVNVLGAARDQRRKELRVVLLLCLLRCLRAGPLEAGKLARDRALLQYADAVTKVFRLLPKVEKGRKSF